MGNLKKKKVDLLKQQQKALRNKLYPETNVSYNTVQQKVTTTDDFGIMTTSYVPVREKIVKRKSLKDVKKEQLRNQQRNLKKPLQKKSFMRMFK